MSVDERLDTLRDLVQRDVGNRGLARDPSDNLLSRYRGDFADACRSVAQAREPSVCVVTGFFIPHGQPPASETDGPLGAVFLARALAPLGIKTALITDVFCEAALTAGLEACGLRDSVLLRTIPPALHPWDAFLALDWRDFRRYNALTHLIALERVGPSHTAESVRGQPGTEPFASEVLPEHHDRCHTMRGLDVTAHTPPAHRLFEEARERPPQLTTIGIGDGGNEIGMGKLPWDTIRRNVPNGGLIACRVAADHLIVAGVSNWGAYALAAGVLLLRGEQGDADLFDPDRERELLRVMVERGPLVDGVTGRPTATVDGLTWEQYAEPLAAMGRLLRL
jgi:hypothetical protein